MTRRPELLSATYSTRGDGINLIHHTGPNGEPCCVTAETEAKARSNGMSANWNKNGDGKPTASRPDGTAYWNAGRDGSERYVQHDLYAASHGPLPDGFHVSFRNS
jgi:hypothetical protein